MERRTVGVLPVSKHLRPVQPEDVGDVALACTRVNPTKPQGERLYAGCYRTALIPGALAAASMSIAGEA